MSMIKPIKITAIHLQIILIIVAGFFVYSNSLNVKFIWDDSYLIERNSYIKSLSGVSHIFKEDIGGDSQVRYSAYRPLQMMTYMLDYAFWKSNVFGYHLTSITLHILVALALYWLIYILCGNTLLPLLTAMLFVVHPVHTEVVTYLSGRSDSLGALFVLLCVIGYIKLADTNKLKWRFFMVLSCILALLARENSVILPLLILIYQYIFKQKIEVKKIISILSVVIIYIALRATILSNLLPNAVTVTDIVQRIPGFFVAITNYLGLLLFPVNLHMEYGAGLFKISNPAAILGIFIVVSAIILALRKKSNKLISFSILWFLVSLLPVSNIFPINAYMAEHWLYLPSLGFFVVLAMSLNSLFKRNHYQVLAAAILISLLAYFSYFTIKQNSYWKNPVIFYERLLRFAQGSPRIYNNLGIAYNENKKYEQAIVIFKKAIEIDPLFAFPYVNLGNSYIATGKIEEAISENNKALQIDPNIAEAYLNLGNAYKEIGKTKEAISAYKKAIHIDRNSAEAYSNLGVLYVDLNLKNEAIMVFEKALSSNPVYLPTYYNLVRLYRGLDKEKEIILLCKKAVAYNVDFFFAYYHLGNLYSQMSEDKEAIKLYQRGIKLNPHDADIYAALGRAYCIVGDNIKAIAALKKAIILNPKFGLAYNNFALVYFYEKQFDLAVKYCNRAIELGYKVSPKLLEMLKPYNK